MCIVNVKATNSSPTPMTEFVFQAAVPKVILLVAIQSYIILSKYLSGASKFSEITNHNIAKMLLQFKMFLNFILHVALYSC